jgi:hypothetical protein
VKTASEGGVRVAHLQSRIERLCYFRTYLERLEAKQPGWDVDRLIRFYLKGTLDYRLMRDFRVWLRSQKLLR